MAKKEIDPIQVGKWLLVGGGLFVGYKILKGLGLIKTGLEEQASTQASNQEAQAEITNLNIEDKNWTNINYYKQTPSGYNTMLMPQQGADYIAKQIWDSYGSWYSDDNEEQMQGALKMIRYKTQYSQVASRFFSIYQEDLTAFLKEHFTSTELYPAWSYLDKLPTGFVKKK